MAIPDYQTIMRPLLQRYAAGAERAIGEVRAELASEFELTDEDLAERLPSNTAKTWHNRVGWATTYLKQCALLQREGQAVYKITERGQQMLEEHPDRIDLTVLSQFPELKKYRTGSGRGRRAKTPTLPALETASTAEDFIGKDTRKMLVNVFYNPGGEGARMEYGYRGLRLSSTWASTQAKTFTNMKSTGAQHRFVGGSTPRLRTRQLGSHADSTSADAVQFQPVALTVAGVGRKAEPPRSSGDRGAQSATRLLTTQRTECRAWHSSVLAGRRRPDHRRREPLTAPS